MSALPALPNQPNLGPSVDYGIIRAGDPEALRSRVLSLVNDELYDLAVKELDQFLAYPSNFPNYKQRLHRYVNHAVELVSAIEAKRSFPGKFSLTTARQQELNDKVKHHWKELQAVLNRIEMVIVSLRADDIRATVWTIRSLCMATSAVLVVALGIELSTGLLSTILAVSGHQIDLGVNGIFNFF